MPPSRASPAPTVDRAETRSAGANVWISRFSENGLRSEFVIGEELFGKL